MFIFTIISVLALTIGQLIVGGNIINDNMHQISDVRYAILMFISGLFNLTIIIIGINYNKDVNAFIRFILATIGGVLPIIVCFIAPWSILNSDSIYNVNYIGNISPSLIIAVFTCYASTSMAKEIYCIFLQDSNSHEISQANIPSSPNYQPEHHEAIRPQSKSDTETGNRVEKNQNLSLCSKCGIILQTNTIFCTNCGARIEKPF